MRKHQIPTPALLVDGKFSVLIVEDDPEVADLMKKFFERQGGYQIFSASDGISALIEVGRAKPDLLVLDVMIPGVDGIEVCRRIKTDATSKAIIIAISGQPDAEKKVLNAGADAFMAKPVDMDKLLSEAARLLRVL